MIAWCFWNSHAAVPRQLLACPWLKQYDEICRTISCRASVAQLILQRPLQRRPRRFTSFWRRDPQCSLSEATIILEAVRGRFDSSPRTAQLELLFCPLDFHKARFSLPKVSRSKLLQRLAWRMHPLTDSPIHMIHESTNRRLLHCFGDWRSCRSVWWTSWNIQNERTNTNSRKFVPSTSWFFQTFCRPSYWKQVVLK